MIVHTTEHYIPASAVRRVAAEIVRGEYAAADDELDRQIDIASRLLDLVKIATPTSGSRADEH